LLVLELKIKIIQGSDMEKKKLHMGWGYCQPCLCLWETWEKTAQAFARNWEEVFFTTSMFVI